MLGLIYYEIRKNYKSILSILVGTIIGGLILSTSMTRGGLGILEVRGTSQEISLASVLMVYATVPIVGVFILAMINLINELDNKTSQLIFSLPVRESKILISKILFAIIIFILVASILRLSLDILVNKANRLNEVKSRGQTIRLTGGSPKTFVLSLILGAIYHLILMYFIIVANKLIRGTRELSGWYILIFLVFKYGIDKFKDSFIIKIPFVYEWGIGIVNIGDRMVYNLNTYITGNFLNLPLIIIDGMVVIILSLISFYIMDNLLEF